MPIYELALPDNRVLTLEAPDDKSALTAASQWHATNPVKMGAGEDLARSAGSGLVEGAINTLGMTGGLRNMTTQAAAWAAKKMGGDPQTVDRAATAYADLMKKYGRFLPMGQMMAGPTAADVKTAMPQSIQDAANYQPQTMAGKYAKTTAEFVPGLLAPGGTAKTVAGNVAKRVVNNVVAPGLGSETAGQIAQQVAPDYEGAARLVGGVGAGSVASVANAPSRTKIATQAIQDVKDAAVRGYQSPEVGTIIFKPMAVE